MPWQTQQRWENEPRSRDKWRRRWIHDWHSLYFPALHVDITISLYGSGIEPEKSDIVWVGFNTDVEVGTCYHYCYCFLYRIESKTILCHKREVIPNFLLAIFRSVSMLASYYGIEPERPQNEEYYTNFHFVRQYVSSEAYAGESATLIYITYIHLFMNERCLQKANIMAI